MQLLTAIPVYNEEKHLDHVLDEVRRYSPNILVVNDGSKDRTAELLAKHADIAVITHPHNRGYGAALISAFQYAVAQKVDVLVTMDCDGQHQTARIPVLVDAIHDADIVSGSRYLRDFRQNSVAPEDRQRINRTITQELNEALGVELTDAFCGFKAYRGSALPRLHITESGWGMPLQLWVQAVSARLRIKEVGVPRVYLDSSRAFGGALNDAGERLAYYRRVIADALAEARSIACAETEHGLCCGMAWRPSHNTDLPHGTCR
jgi:glycosyltransferase involved in cell wall biosynthesis